MGSPYSAEALYGAPPVVMATPTPAPTHAPGTPEPTRAIPAPTGVFSNPTVLLILLLAVAVLLVQFSFHGSISLEA
jgi:hypothetical protein